MEGNGERKRQIDREAICNLMEYFQKSQSNKWASGKKLDVSLAENMLQDNKLT